MIKIKFSHIYEKMPRDFERSKLLGVIPIKLEDLGDCFLRYDTAYLDNGELKYYKLPKSGDYMILLLQAGSGLGRLWTTIRRITPSKLDYYRSHVGEVVECAIVP